MERVKGFSTEFFNALSAALFEEVAHLPVARGTSNLLSVPDVLMSKFYGYYEKFKKIEHDKNYLPAGCDWLLDNFYVVERHLKMFKKLYRKDFDRAVLKLQKNGRVYPRIFIICQEFLKNFNQTLTWEALVHVITDLSKKLSFQLAELWALKEMLRIGILQNLSEVYDEVLQELRDRDLILQLFEEVKAEGLTESETALNLLRELFKRKDLLKRQACLIISQLREKPNSWIILSLLENYYKEIGINIEEQFKQIQYHLAERQIFIAESFHSLNELDNFNFSELLEKASSLHEICLADKQYSISDFYSREKTRSSIERLARLSGSTEIEIANQLILKSKKTGKCLFDLLFGADRYEFLDKDLGFSFRAKILRTLGEFKLSIYLGCVIFLALILSLLIFSYALSFNFLHLTLLVVWFLLLLELSFQVVNAFTLRLIKPRFLPKLDLQSLSEEHKVAVVSHGLVSSEEEIGEFLDSLLQRAFSEQDSDFIIWVALLDLPDRSEPYDSEYLNRLTLYINRKVTEIRREHSIKIFALLRNPVKSHTMGKYIGWERKRGKLLEFLRLIRDSQANTTFYNISTDLLNELEGVKYVVTLDADTQMSLGAVRSLIGYAAHPYNKAQVTLDSENMYFVSSGWSIFQPRINFNLESCLKTPFSRLMSDSEGFDPYTREVSDLYFDVFGEANFLGKGLIVVDPFLKCLDNRFPDECILSHDLIESIFARAAFVSQVEFFDDVPTNYLSYTKRLHRWFRGDWQLLPWIFKKSTPILGKWKLLDNLRRSLIPPLILVSIFLSAIIGFNVGKVALLMAFVIFTFPLFISFSQLFALGPRNISFASKLQGFRLDVIKVVSQALYWFCVLPHQSLNALSAVGTTLVRLRTKKNLLEWVTFSLAEKLSKNIGAYLQLVVVQLVAAILLLFFSSSFLGFIFSALFFIAPVVVFLLDQEFKKVQQELTPHIENYFRGVAFETFLFFYEHLNKAQKWLIIDNQQNIPEKILAERTSPTNLGFSLLAYPVAYKLGIIDLKTAVMSIRNILLNIDKLEKFFGHLYNWYDTNTSSPLNPRYISFADSGNLAACLIVIKSFLSRAPNLPLLDKSAYTFWKNTFNIDLVLDSSSLNISNLGSSCAEIVQRNLEIVSNYPNAFDEIPEILKNELFEAIKLSKALTVKLISEMNFNILFNESKKLFSIGYNVDSARRDTGCYDFLCSEARLGYFVAISYYGFDPKIWFKLSRIIGDVHDILAPLSWSGTMFEYLMPEIFLKTFEGSFMGFAVKSAIEVQKRYGMLNKVPWGVSESAYGIVDLNGNFQYKAFGVPGLGLKRGLFSDLVVSPYSSLMAAMYVPKDSYENLINLETNYNARRTLGFVESIDFSRDRLPTNQSYFVVDAHFAHHQGMSLSALGNLLCNSFIKELFHDDPKVSAAESILFEKKPKVIVTVSVEDVLYTEPDKQITKTRETTRILNKPSSGLLSTHFVSNSKLLSLIDSSGSGFIVFTPDLFLTRWRPEPVKANYGYFFYIKDEGTGELYSASYQPLKKLGELYEFFTSPDKFEIKQRFGSLFCYYEGTVSTVFNADIRKISLTNLGPKTIVASICSYAEVCLATFPSDVAHPAFQKLFIESKFVREKDCLIFKRRPRSHNEKPIFLGHRIVLDRVFKPTEFETKREKFIGRGRDESHPIGMTQKTLTNSAGLVLDPIMAIKQYFRVPPGQTEFAYFITAIANSEDELLYILDNLSDKYSLHYQFELSWSQNNIELKSEIFNPGNFITYQQLVNLLLLYDPPENLPGFKFSQRDLWKLGISGDNRIVLVILKSQKDLRIVFEILEAFAYASLKGFIFDLVILNLISEGYIQSVRERIENFMRSKGFGHLIERKGGIYIRSKEQVSESDLEVLKAFSAVQVNPGNLSLSELLDKLLLEKQKGDEFTSEIKVKHAKTFDIKELEEIDIPISDTCGFDTNHNFIGFFRFDSLPNAPWSHVLANETVGILTTERGSSFAWAINSREFRLQPWSNDPVKDPSGECFYLRDVVTGEIFSPQLILKDDFGPIKVQYDQSSAIYKRIFGDKSVTLAHRVCENSIVSSFKLYGNYQKTEFFYYLEPVLGVNFFETNRFLIFDIDLTANAIIVSNPANEDFNEWCWIIWFSVPIDSFTFSQREFIGQYGSVREPGIFSKFKANEEVKLSNSISTSGFKSIAVKLMLTEEQDTSVEIIKFLVKESEKQSFIEKLKNKEFNLNFEDLKNQKELATIHLKSSCKATDILFTWLFHQTLNCRLWGRSGFYQSGGAYGFRDQLQDSLAMLYVNPNITRNQILLHASRQFIEGDVQHWWHPPSGKGTRTRFSDDFLWLPYTVIRYINSTGDKNILNTFIEYIKGPQLKEDQHEIYIVPESSNVKESLYEHCKKSLINGMRYGHLGLPLIGIGDWNDGFSEVGSGGKGQSVWLGWFQAWIFKQFSKIARDLNDLDFAAQLEIKAEELVDSVEKFCWDGEWYIRAFFDDGTPLGSSRNSECKIDSLVQSWAVLTDLGSKERTSAALDSCLKFLVDKSNRIIKLLSPPFDKSNPSPGYIQGYMPGLRENGAQYTHAAIWLIMAFAHIGRREEAFELFKLINPVDIYLSDIDAKNKYVTEPYVLCGDVYSHPSMIGRGGWSWYTGSSGWAIQLILKYFIGVELESGFVKFNYSPVSQLGDLELLWGCSKVIIFSGFSKIPKVFINNKASDQMINLEDLLSNENDIVVDWRE